MMIIIRASNFSKSAILFFVLISFSISGFCEDFLFRQYSNEQGLNHSFIYSVSQDTSGFLWIGTSEGLYRFDGFVFDYFTVEDGLSENFISKIHADQNGNVWIGHQNGSISQYSDKSFKIFSDSSVNYGSVSDLETDAEGVLWATVQNSGLISIDMESNMRVFELPNLNNQLTSLTFIGPDKFLLGSHEDLYLAKYDKSSEMVVIERQFEAYNGSKVVDILEFNQNAFIILSQETGLYSLQMDQSS